MRVIYVTEHLHDADLVQRIVDPGRSAVVVEPCPTPDQAFARLATGMVCDAVLVDESLPGGEAVSFITALRARSAELPIVLLTTTADELVATRAVAAGADECLPKREHQLVRLAPLLERLTRHAREEGERRLPRVLHLNLAAEVEQALSTSGRLLLEPVAVDAAGALVTPAHEPLQWATADALVVQPPTSVADAAVALRRFRTQYPNLPVFVVSSDAEAAGFLRLGAVDVWQDTTPVDRLVRSIERSTLMRHLALENSVLKAKERRLRALVEAVPEAVLLVGPEGSLLAVNQSGLTLLGADTARDVVGRSLVSFVRADDQAAAAACVEAVCRGDSRTLRLGLKGSDGTSRPVDLRAVAFQREPGRPSTALMVLREVPRVEEAVPPTGEVSPVVAAARADAEELERLRVEVEIERSARRTADEAAERVLDRSLAEVASWKERVDALEAERERWRREAESASGSLEHRLVAAREQATAEREQLVRARLEMEERLAGAQRLLDAVEAERRDLSAEAARLRDETSGLASLHDEWQRDRAALQARLGQALAEAHTHAVALERASAELQDQSALREQLEKAHDETRRLDAQLRFAEDQLLARKAEAAELPAAFEHHRVLEAQVQAAMESVRAREAAIASLTNTLEEQRARIPLIESARQEAQRALAERDARLVDMERRLRDAEALVKSGETARQELTRSSEARIAQLRADADEWHARADKQAERAERLEGVVRDLQNQLDAARGQAQSAGGRLDQALAELELALAERDTKIHALGEELQARAGLVASLEATRGDLETRAKQQADKADQLEAFVRDMQAQLDAAGDQARAAEARWRASKRELENASAEFDEAHTQADPSGTLGRHGRWVLESAGIGLVETAPDGTIISGNEAAAKLFDAPAADLSGKRMPQPVLDIVETGIARGARSQRFEVCLEHTNGRLYWLLGVVASRTPDAGRQVLDWVMVDVSEQKLSARRRWFLKRMEKITQYLTSAAGECSPLMDDVAGAVEDLACALEQAGGSHDIERTRHSITRTRAVLVQLSEVAQRRIRRPVVVDLNELLDRASVLLGRLAGEDSPCEIQTYERELLATVDPGEIEQALAALVVWARESLPAGGTITVAASAARADDGSGRDSVLRQIAAITVTAEGFGAQATHAAPLFEETLQRIGADLDVRHESGVRTTLVLRLPRVGRAGVRAAQEASLPASVEGRA